MNEKRINIQQTYCTRLIGNSKNFKSLYLSGDAAMYKAQAQNNTYILIYMV